MLATKLFSLVVLAASAFAVPTRTSGGNALAARHNGGSNNNNNGHHNNHNNHNSGHDSPAPSASASGAHHKRNLKREVIPVTLGLGTEDAARCPSGMMACPVTTMTLLEAANASSGVDFDCVAWKEDLYSCGGCSTMGTGTDCTALPGVGAVECSAGACHVLSCATGFIASDGSSCVPALVSQ